MSQDAEQPKSRRDLRRTQVPVSSTPEEALEREYPSVPLLPPSGLPQTAESSPGGAVHRDRGAHAAEAARTRQAHRAEERARLAAEAARLAEQQSSRPAIAEPSPASEPVSQPTAEPVAGVEALRRRRASDSPPDAAPEVEGAPKAERNSQVRARNRAALRAYREVVEAEREVPLPSRRLLRQQQVDAERAPATNPHGLKALPTDSGNSTSASGQVAPDRVAPAEAGERVAAPNQLVAAPGDETPVIAAPDQPNFTPRPQAPSGLSIPEALAERDALLEDVRQFAASLPPDADPLAVDLEVLAQQKALAERAAILNERALARARLAEESAEARQRLNDPTVAHNLAMVTPLQFVKVPGVEDPVLKPPATSHVPVVTRSSPLTPPPIRPPATPPRSMPAVSELASESAPAVQPVNQSTGSGGRHGRAQVLRRAEEVAQVRPRPTKLSSAGDSSGEAEAQPLPAQSAHGLEPLDAVTAGLGRVQRTRILQWGVAAVGLAALIAGLSMIITTMAR